MMATGQSTRVPARILLLASFIVTALAMPTALAGALAVDISADLGLTVADLGLAVGGFFFVSTLLSGSMGAAVQRVGWTTAMRIGAAASGGLLIGIGMAATSTIVFGLLLIVAGAVNALGHPSGNLALAAEVPAQRHGLVFGVKHAAIPLATVLAGLSVPVLAGNVGWRGTYALAAVLHLSVFVGVPRRESARTRPPQPSQPRARVATRTPRRLLYTVAAASMFGVFGAHALGTFLVTYGVVIGISKEMAAVVLAVGSAGGIAMRIFMGWWADRSQRDGIPLMMTLMIVGALGHLMLAFGGTSLFLVATIAAFAGGWGWTGLMTYSVVSRNRESAAVATGISQSGVYAGATIGPIVFGFVAEQVGYQSAWALSSALLVVGAVFAFIFALLAPIR